MKPKYQGHDVEGIEIITKPNDCNDCYHFSTNSMVWPGGKCTLHDVDCGMGYTCDSWLDRKEGAAKRQVELAQKILDEPEKYEEYQHVIAKEIIARGGRRD